MHIEFQKIHGAGNDFVLFDNRQGHVKLSEEQVRKICDRHFGVGADGVIEVRPSERAQCTAYMYYRNADGSLAEMCGNGVRCFARYLADNNLLSEEEMASRSFIVDTLAGPRPLTYETDDMGKLINATVGMGEPTFTPEQIPTTLRATQEIAVYDSTINAMRMEQAVVQSAIREDVCTYVITCVNMGNPHAVMFLDSIDSPETQVPTQYSRNIELEGPGAFLESNIKLFPQKTNVEVAVIQGANHIRMRVYERGVGETLACGTGACAVAITAIILGKAKREEPVRVDLPGGTLIVEWLQNNQVLLTGPAETVFCGSIAL